MLSFFRRIINSRVGVIVTLAVLGVIALAFAAGDVSGLRTQGMTALTGNGVAKVGRETVSVDQLKQRAAAELESARQQQPTLTMAQFVAAGGVDSTLQRMVTGLAFARFAGTQGMIVSKRAVDGQLASIPGLQGLNGKFDDVTYRRLLAARKLTDVAVRRDLAQQTLVDQLTQPTIGASQVPAAVALPYASLLLEKRQGQIAFVPTQKFVTEAMPGDADLIAYYRRNVARYTIPPLRVVRYALVTADTVKARATPTDAEIAAAYAANRARYLPAEKRTVESVVAADQATAIGITAKVRGGASVAEAAKAAGLEAATAAAQDKATLTAATSPAVADAVFGAPKGELVGPVKAPLGFVVARVAAIEQVAGKSLDQAKGEIAADLAKTKTLRAMGAVHDAMDDALGHNGTFDEVAGDQKLAAVTTSALLASGIDVDHPEVKPDPSLAPILAAAFQAEENDPPQLVSVGRDGNFALVALSRVVAAASRPLAAIKAGVVHDYQVDQARAAARKVAAAIVAKADAGTPFAQALAGAGAGIAPAKPVAATRAQLASSQGAPPPALVLLFNMGQGKTKLLETPGNAGWLLIHVDSIVPGNAVGAPQVVAATRADLGRLTGREYAEQFARAVRAQVGVSIDNAALARVKADLAGNGAGNGSAPAGN